MSPAANKPLRILGVDPGLRITGFGIIEKSGNALSYLASGCIKTDAKGDKMALDAEQRAAELKKAQKDQDYFCNP